MNKEFVNFKENLNNNWQKSSQPKSNKLSSSSPKKNSYKIKFSNSKMKKNKCNKKLILMIEVSPI